MKKEVLIAIIIGFTLGLIITFGIHTAQQSLKLKKQLASNQNTHLTPTPAAPTQPLTIASPDNGMVFHQANLQVTGTTTPQALISVIATDSYTTAAADFQGNFSAPITLAEGANLIQVEAFADDGQSNQKTLTVIYLPRQTAKVPSPTPSRSQASPTPANDIQDITENVKQRIQEVILDQAVPTTAVAYGHLASISNDTLTIEGDAGVKLASISAQTTFIRLPGNTKLTFEDLAIDEYLIAVGIDNNQVINATQVISQRQVPVLSLQTAFSGLITQYDSDDYYLTLTHPVTQEAKTFLLGRKSQIFLADSNGTKSAIDRTQSFPVNSHALAIYEPTKDSAADIVAQEILILPSSPIITPPELKP